MLGWLEDFCGENGRFTNLIRTFEKNVEYLEKEYRNALKSGDATAIAIFDSKLKRYKKENSDKIDDPEKCIALIKRTFGQFFKDAWFDKNNMDLMCALHLDRPEHLHIHYVFWEKEPKIKNQRAAGYKYRAKGKISMEAIDRMTERLNAYTIDDDLAKKRQKVVDELIGKSDEYDNAQMGDLLRGFLKELADKLPKDKPLWYGSKEVKPHRIMIDTVAEWLIDRDDGASKAHYEFMDELRLKKQKLKCVMDNYYKRREEKELHIVQNMDGFTEIGAGLKTLHTIEALEWDYRRRLGNIVLKKVRDIQNETYRRNPRRKYKTNDKNLKRSLAISARKVRGLMDGLFFSVAELFSPETERCRNRLGEIEEELQAENEKENCPQEQTKPINSKWNWGK